MIYLILNKNVTINCMSNLVLFHKTQELNIHTIRKLLTQQELNTSMKVMDLKITEQKQCIRCNYEGRVFMNDSITKKFFAIIAIILIIFFAGCGDNGVSGGNYGNDNDTVKVWDGTIDVSWYNTNVERDTFFITNGQELAGLSKIVRENGITFENKVIILKNNIDLANRNWIPIGDNGVCFSGIFEGNKKTISNLLVSNFIYAGLFGYVNGINAKIKNLVVNVTEITTEILNTRGYAGGLAGYYYSTSSIENCGVNIKDSVSTSSRYSAHSGGLVGSVGDELT